MLTFSASPSDVEFDYYGISLYTASDPKNMQQDFMVSRIALSL